MVEGYDVDKVRQEFPILQRTVHGQPLVYLDNAATSQKPRVVVDAMSDFLLEHNANVHRGVHQLSQEATEAYDGAHHAAADLIGAEAWHEVVFTRNATEALNVVAQGWGRDRLGPGDTVVVTELEHHSNFVPWQQVAERSGAALEVIPVTDDGYLDLEAAKDIVDGSTKVLSVTHTSNVLGTEPPLDALGDLAADAGGTDGQGPGADGGALFVVDASQAVPHRPVDVGRIGCDFLAFTGHKMCGPTGIGVLWGREEILEATEPLLFGGEMIRRVTLDASEWNVLPWKFEPGTPPIAEAVGLAAAIEFLTAVGLERVRAHGRDLVARAFDRLSEIDGLTIYGPPPEDRAAIVSFNVEGVHAHDLSSLLDDHGVAVRSGHHCAQPLMDRLGTPATTRASFYLYNTRAEVDRLADAVRASIEVFQ